MGQSTSSPLPLAIPLPFPDDALMRIAVKCMIYPQSGMFKKNVSYTFEGTRAELARGDKWDAPAGMYAQYIRGDVQSLDRFCADAARGAIDHIWGIEIWLDCRPNDYVACMIEVDNAEYALDQKHIERLLDIIEEKKLGQPPTHAHGKSMVYFQEEMQARTVKLETHGVHPETVHAIMQMLEYSPRVKTIHFSRETLTRWEKVYSYTSIERGLDPLVRQDADLMGRQKQTK